MNPNLNIIQKCVSNILDFYSKMLTIMKDFHGIAGEEEQINVTALSAAHFNILFCLEIVSLIVDVDCDVFLFNFFCFVSSGYALLLFNIVNDEKVFLKMLAVIIVHHNVSLVEKITDVFGKHIDSELRYMLNDYERNFAKERSIHRLLSEHELRYQLLDEQREIEQKEEEFAVENGNDDGNDIVSASIDVDNGIFAHFFHFIECGLNQP